MPLIFVCKDSLGLKQEEKPFRTFYPDFLGDGAYLSVRSFLQACFEAQRSSSTLPGSCKKGMVALIEIEPCSNEHL